MARQNESQIDGEKRRNSRLIGTAKLEKSMQNGAGFSGKT